MKLFFASCFLFLASTTISYGWSLFGPNNYEDCVIEGLKGVTSNRVIVEIKKACRSKFPIKVRRLKKKEIEKISIQAVFVDDDGNWKPRRVRCTPWGDQSEGRRHICSDSIRVHNQNSDVTIASITLELSVRGAKLSVVLDQEWSGGLDPLGTITGKSTLGYVPLNIRPRDDARPNYHVSFDGKVNWPETVYPELRITRARGY